MIQAVTSSRALSFWASVAFKALISLRAAPNSLFFSVNFEKRKYPFERLIGPNLGNKSKKITLKLYYVIEMKFT